MLRRLGTLSRQSLRPSTAQLGFFASKKYKIIDSPSQISKLVFNQDGLCKIYEFKTGEHNLRKLVRYITGLTFINGLLFGLEEATPIFGHINLISFGLVTGLGYFMLSLLQIYSRRMVHRIFIADDFQTIHVECFNAFWKPETHTFNISEFQEPVPGFADFTRFELTRAGKIWINLNRNQFKNVQDYEQTLEYVLLGKPLTNLNLINMRKKASG